MSLSLDDIEKWESEGKVKKLVKALTEKEEIREKALQSLNKLGWVPEHDDDTIRYLFAQGKIDECSKYGEKAVDVLISGLYDLDLLQPCALAIKRIGSNAIEQLITSAVIVNNDMNLILQYSSSLSEKKEKKVLEDIRKLDAFGKAINLIGEEAVDSLKRHFERTKMFGVSAKSAPKLILLLMLMARIPGREMLDMIKSEMNTEVSSLMVGAKFLSLDQDAQDKYKAVVFMYCLGAASALGASKTKAAAEYLLNFYRNKRSYWEGKFYLPDYNIMDELKKTVQDSLIEIGANAVDPVFNSLESLSRMSIEADVLTSIKDYKAVYTYLEILKRRKYTRLNLAITALGNIFYNKKVISEYFERIMKWNIATLSKKEIEERFAGLEDEKFKAIFSSLLEEILKRNPEEAQKYLESEIEQFFTAYNQFYDLLLSILKSNNEKEVNSAVAILEKNPGKDLFEKIYGIMQEDVPDFTKAGIIRIMSNIPDPDMGKRLHEILKTNNSKTIVDEVLRSLGRLQYAASAYTIRELLKKSVEAETCVEAIVALRKINDTQSTDVFISLLDSDNKQIFKAAADALGRMQCEKAIDPMIRKIQSPDREVRDVICNALKKFDDPRAAEAIKKYGPKCFIASAVYDDYECIQLKVLRVYRDTVLTQTFWGRCFVKIYYSCSPYIASCINHSNMNGRIRGLLDFFIDKTVRPALQVKK